MQTLEGGLCQTGATKFTDTVNLCLLQMAALWRWRVSVFVYSVSFVLLSPVKCTSVSSGELYNWGLAASPSGPLDGQRSKVVLLWRPGFFSHVYSWSAAAECLLGFATRHFCMCLSNICWFCHGSEANVVALLHSTSDCGCSRVCYCLIHTLTFKLMLKKTRRKGHPRLLLTKMVILLWSLLLKSRFWLFYYPEGEDSRPGFLPWAPWLPSFD